MKPQFILPLNDENATLETVGGKGASLAILKNAGLPVPDGFHITTDAYRKFVADNGLWPKIQAALSGVDIGQPQTLEIASKTIREVFLTAPIPMDIEGAVKDANEQLLDTPVAVRSSATAEDLPEASFAGQQETYLNIMGASNVLQAVKKCWASLWTARAIGYRAKQKINPDGVALAVVVQALVPADAAGILFTANPTNGRRDQMLISASWGLGEAVVGGLVTPDTLTLGKPSTEVVKRQTSPKLVQTTCVLGGTEESPVPESLQKNPVLNDMEASELGKLGLHIENLYGMPMDIEWTLCDGTFNIVQARPITALKEPPLEWVLPNPKGVYMRGSVVDLMPDPLSPLFASWGFETLKQQFRPLGKRLTRIEPDMADDYFTSINGYAYMNTTFPPRLWKWILFGLLPSYPRILRTLVPLWRDELRPEYQAAISLYQDSVPSEMTAGELWRKGQEILNAAMYYVAGLMFATMGASAGSEGLLTTVYNKMVKKEGDPDAATLLIGWDNLAVQSEKSLFDLAMWIKGHKSLVEYILRATSKEIFRKLNAEEIPSGVEAQDWGGFCKKFDEHVQQFGYMIFQLDFAEPLPLDHPEPMLEIVKMFVRGEGVNPHERQRTSEEKRLLTTETMLTRTKGLKGWAFRKALEWGQSMAEVREDAIAEIGLGYPMLRAMLLELGKRVVEGGGIERAEDIFWLEKPEIVNCVALLEEGSPLKNYAGLVVGRKAFVRRAKQVDAPAMMPEKDRIMGIKTESFIPHSAEGQSGDTLTGAATSAGVVTAPACVLHGPDDFANMKPGDVLIASTTTPAWTPLFAMASAVVTDIGGPLSHGSIVAREYGIPAVMGTSVATRRIQNGQTITVDGNKGTVSLSENARGKVSNLVAR